MADKHPNKMDYYPMVKNVIDDDYDGPWSLFESHRGAVNHYIPQNKYMKNFGETPTIILLDFFFAYFLLFSWDVSFNTFTTKFSLRLIKIKEDLQPIPELRIYMLR